jgi:hypothetical protein
MAIGIVSAHTIETQGMTTTSLPGQVTDVHVPRMTRLLAIAVVGTVLIAADMKLIRTVEIHVMISTAGRIPGLTGTLLLGLTRLLEACHLHDGVKIAIRETNRIMDGTATRNQDMSTGGRYIEVHRAQRLSISIQDRYRLATTVPAMDINPHSPINTTVHLLLVRPPQRFERKGWHRCKQTQ